MKFLHWILFPMQELFFLGQDVCSFLFSFFTSKVASASGFLLLSDSFFSADFHESIRQDLQMLNSFASRSSALLQGVP